MKTRCDVSYRTVLLVYFPLRKDALCPAPEVIQDSAKTRLIAFITDGVACVSSRKKSDAYTPSQPIRLARRNLGTRGDYGAPSDMA